MEREWFWIIQARILSGVHVFQAHDQNIQLNILSSDVAYNNFIELVLFWVISGLSLFRGKPLFKLPIDV